MFVVGTPVFYLALFVLGLFLILKKFFKGTLFKVIGINFVVILFLIALFDSVAAMLFDRSDSFRVVDNFYHHGLKAMANEKTSWKSDGVSFYQIYTNSLSFVDETDREVPLKKNGKRILILGDSFMEGVGYPWPQTVPGILSERFKKQGVELLNAAVISYSPKIYYLKLKHFLEMGLEIDELYVFIDISDIIDEVVYDYFVPKEFSQSELKWQALDNFFIKGSYIYRSTKTDYFAAQINPYHENAPVWGGLANFYGLKPRWTYDENAMIMKELAILINYLRSNVPIESAFEEFARRSGLEDIKSFSDIFSTAKRTGGNIISIIRSTASVIRTRVELKRELRTMMASKKYESDIMRMIPFGILLYLRIFSPEMISSLYGNAFGIIFMTVILIVYTVLSAAADRMIRISY